MCPNTSPLACCKAVSLKIFPGDQAHSADRRHRAERSRGTEGHGVERSGEDRDPCGEAPSRGACTTVASSAREDRNSVEQVVKGARLPPIEFDVAQRLAKCVGGEGSEDHCEGSEDGCDSAGGHGLRSSARAASPVWSGAAAEPDSFGVPLGVAPPRPARLARGCAPSYAARRRLAVTWV